MKLILSYSAILLILVSCENTSQTKDQEVVLNNSKELIDSNTINNSSISSSYDKVIDENFYRNIIDSLVNEEFNNQAIITGKRVYKPQGKIEGQTYPMELDSNNIVFGEARLTLNNDTLYYRVIFDNMEIFYSGQYNPNK